MTVDLDKLEYLAKETNSRESWVAVHEDDRDFVVTETANRRIASLVYGLTPMSPELADFIAAVDPTTVISLIEHVRALRTVVRNMTGIAREHMANIGLHHEHVDWKYVAECRALIATPPDNFTPPKQVKP